MKNSEDIIARISSFYAHGDIYNDPFVEGDDKATTFSCCGAILLAAVFTGSRSSKLLSCLTGLPDSFANAVLWMMYRDHFWNSEPFAHFERTVAKEPENWTEIGESLFCHMENFWSASVDCEMHHLLEETRARHLIGGGVQDWVDEDELELFLASLNIEHDGYEGCSNIW